MKAFLVLMAFAIHAVVPGTAAADSMKDIEGVYKKRFMNGLITPGKEQDTYYQAEDILEIVPHDEEHIYFRVHLHYYNGHMCSLHGMAKREGPGFVFRDEEEPFEGDERCALTITPSRDAITLTDRASPAGPATCRNHCGARGSLSNISMPMKLRRPIRYMDRILNSRQYKDAAGQLAKPRADQSDR